MNNSIIFSVNIKGPKQWKSSREPELLIIQQKMAEARGFEPPVRLPAHTLSKRAP